jgi:hypothetical protein
MSGALPDGDTRKRKRDQDLYWKEQLKEIKEQRQRKSREEKK